jgi:hypothetical protein
MPDDRRDQEPTGDAVRASLAVVEGAIELARAEAKLVLLQARTSVASALIVALCVFTAVTFVELTLVLVAISPLYFLVETAPSARPLLVSLGIALGLAVASALVARAAWQRMDPRKPPKPSSPPQPSPR